MPHDGGSQPKELVETGQMQLEKPWPRCLSRDLAGHSPAPLRNTLRKLFQQPPPRRDNSISPSSCHPCSCHPCSLECLSAGRGCCTSLPRGRNQNPVCANPRTAQLPPGSLLALWLPGGQSWGAAAPGASQTLPRTHGHQAGSPGNQEQSPGPSQASKDRPNPAASI